MKHSIEKHIFELLKHHDCVIINGLGGFILNNRPIFLNQITNTIHPASKLISFNQKLNQNDGLLANYLIQVEGIGYDDACLEILKFVRKSKLRLQNNETIVFEEIGELKLNNSQNIEFFPKSEFNFQQSSYGLKSIQLTTLNSKTATSKQNLISAAVIILLICLSVFSLTEHPLDNFMLFNLNPTKTDQYQPRKELLNTDSLGVEIPGIYNVKVSQVDFDLYKINGTNYHIATKKCFKLGFGRDVQIKIWRDEKDRTQRQVCFLNVTETEYDDCYKITNVYNQLAAESKKVMVLTKRGKMKEAMLVLEETYIDPYIIANTVPEEIVYTDNNLDSLDIKNIATRFTDAIQSLNSSVPKTSQEKIKIQSPETNTTKKNIYIIVGSFSDQKNAEALSKQLKSRGFPNAEIIGRNVNGLIRVSVNSFYTEEEAHIVLEEVKRQLSSAWVLNNQK